MSDTIDLTPFCDPDSYRYDFSAPIVQGGWKYAADSRACVRIPCDEPDSVPPEGKRYPNCGSLFPATFPECDLPLGDELVRIDERKSDRPFDSICGCDSLACKTCDGDGRHKCGTCEGEGTCECECCHQEHDCGTCDGTGRVGKCPACKGSGIEPGVEPCTVCSEPNPRILYRIGDAVISRSMWMRIKALPNVRFRPATDNEHAISFVFDGGGQGLVMPIVSRVLEEQPSI